MHLLLPYFFRDDFGEEDEAALNFSYLASSSGLFRMAWTLLKKKQTHFVSAEKKAVDIFSQA